MLAGNFDNGNRRIEQRSQRTLGTKRQDGNASAFAGERVAKQDHIPLRAAAFEGTQDHREIKSSSVNSVGP